MDDLVDLSWTGGSAAPKTKTQDTYNFDALLRSMPQQGQRPAPPKPAPQPPRTQKAAAAGDAFESLLPTSWGGPAQKPMAMAQTKQTPQNPVTKPTDAWELGVFDQPIAATKPTPAPAPMPAKASDSLLDLDIFDAPAQHTGPSTASTTAHTDIDDILGDLARPVAPKPAPQKAPARSSSPPPHIVGQLVEMGFSPADARNALAKTNGDLAAAADMLAAHEEARAAEERRYYEEEEEALSQRRQTASPAARPQRQSAPQPAGRPDTRPQSANAQANPEWQKQADAIYQQATELSSNVLNRANAFWNSAKAQAQRALDESGSAEPSVANIAAGLRREALRRWGGKPREREWTGKPRWMAEVEDEPSQVAENSGSERRPSTPQSNVPPATRVPPRTAPTDTAAKPVTRPAPQPATRPAARPATRPATQPTARPTTQPVAKPAARPAAPPAKVRSEPQQDASVVQRAAALKSKGNDEYSRGAYGAAEGLYSEALNILDPKSLLRIPLLNNRASARLKNGDSTGAAADSTAVITLIVPGTATGAPLVYAAAADALPDTLSDAVNLRESWAKALMQRASANEAAERWKAAADDWDALALFERTEGSSVRAGERNRKAASEGKTRCANMLRPAPKAAASKPAAPSRAAQQAAAAGVARIRAQRDAQENIEAEQLRLKDSVDARIAQWTAGKDGNVRALLSSIDDPQYALIWPELRWKKVGMHELVTDAQVKRAYTRAIARLHPDKQGNASVEQRMLATSMFHALNSAYCT
ncbi:auxilin-like clathrin-binding protein required for normal clathrin function [Malassezia cuniculi]|uniref:Auxilin-like clathrin-binding protein required for normal clathrin function n=1 Tax=Malassezia cuniculi TaxID=948313 RepID=A0AAF0EZG5_9BASI|nr:auxilin-like clathrin-binding protein required for normal clathrin function [Malassezia cuniculi]